jgi:hypothetical protein
LQTKKSQIDEFLEMVQNNHFVEAHEVLEIEWKELKKEDNKDKAKFIQALINGSTAIALWLKQRPEPSLRVWEVLQRNKHLISCFELKDMEKYQQAIDLLEQKFKDKENL